MLVAGFRSMINRPTVQQFLLSTPIKVNGVDAPCSDHAVAQKDLSSAPVQTYLRRRSGTGACRASPLAIVAAPYLQKTSANSGATTEA